MILARTGLELSCGQASGWHTDGQTDACNDNTWRPNWPRVKTYNQHSKTRFSDFACKSVNCKGTLYNSYDNKELDSCLWNCKLHVTKVREPSTSKLHVTWRFEIQCLLWHIMGELHDFLYKTCFLWETAFDDSNLYGHKQSCIFRFGNMCCYLKKYISSSYMYVINIYGELQNTVTEVT